MEEKQELQELLERIEQSVQRQAKYARLQCILTGAAAVCCGGLILLVCALMPQVQELVGQMQALLPQVEELAGQMETVMANMEVITAQLAAVDFEGTVRNVDALVAASQSAVEQAVDKLNAIDLDTLNQAIEDLAAVVEPLARFFNLFG